MCKLTTLPLYIQSHILSFLCTHESLHPRTSRWKPPCILSYRDPPVILSLACAETLTVLLPPELLSPAEASPILAAAVAKLLTSRVSYLTTCNTADKLVPWITAFAPYVKAVSTWDPFYEMSYDACFREKLVEALENRFETSRSRYFLRLFQSLSLDAVGLEVLDLTDVTYVPYEDSEDELLGGLCTVLESNSITLRELALPVFRNSTFTEKALKMSTLKRLKVFTVKVSLLENGCHWDYPVLGKGLHPVMDMIRAVDGHADRSLNLSTLEELRLLNFGDLPYKTDINDSDVDIGVFHTIKTLKICTDPIVITSTRLFIPFISLFKKLERLFWNDVPSPLLFDEACAKFSELHFYGAHWVSFDQIGGADYHLFKYKLIDHQRYPFGVIPITKNHESIAIRSIVTYEVSPKEIRKLTNCCPNLEYLSLHLNPDDWASLRELLVKCEHIKGLELLLDAKQDRFRYTEVWWSLSRIIPTSHKNLCQFSMLMMDMKESRLTCVNAVMNCLRELVTSVGERAKRIVFRMRFNLWKDTRIIEKLCELLNTCIQHTPRLEALQLDLSTHKRKSQDGWKLDDRLVKRLFQSRNELLRKIPSLDCLDLGVWHGLSKRLSRDMNPGCTHD